VPRPAIFCSPPPGEADWRRSADTWGERYRANPSEDRMTELSSTILETRNGRHYLASAAAFWRRSTSAQLPVISEFGDQPSGEAAQRRGRALGR
jgi:hypothetical protein